MEVRNTADNSSSKEKHGVFSYSINGILGLKSSSDPVKDQDSENAEEMVQNEGNHGNVFRRRHSVGRVTTRAR